MTKPSRRRSKGLEWPDVDSAVMLPKAAIPIGSSPPAWEIAASAPPVTTASQRPSPMRRKALPMAWVAEAHAVTTVSHGPRRPKRIEIAAAPAFPIIIGTSRGETRRGPLAMRRIICSWIVARPPVPVPKMTPTRPGSAPSSPASASAPAAAAIENWAKRSVWRASFGSNHPAGSKAPTHWGPTAAEPDRPAKKASLPMPQDARTPRPVTTTRRRGPRSVTASRPRVRRPGRPYRPRRARSRRR